MNTEKRIYLSRVVEKIQNNPNYAIRLGIKNTSKLETTKKERKESC